MTAADRRRHTGVAVAPAVALWVLLSLAAGCASDGGPSVGGASAGQGGGAGQGGAGGSTAAQAGQGGVSGTAGKASDPCAGKSCDDSIACTLDTCQAGECVHKVDATACPKGQFCTVEKGCVGAPACANDQQCADAWKADPCKANPRCDSASSVCVFDPLDKDKDGHSPLVCGGDDCDDSDSKRYPGRSEECDQRDDDCDGDLDVGAKCPVTPNGTGDVYACISGACQCKPEFLCGKDCVPDKDTNTLHCGSCSHACFYGETCQAGQCVCGQDIQNDILHCGKCGHACAPGEACSMGVCACSPALQGQCGTPTWTNSELSFCLLGYESPSKIDWLSSRSVDATGTAAPCTEESKAATASTPWFTQSLSYGCTGKIKLCASTKAGLFGAPTPQDCTIQKVCSEVDYPAAGATVEAPPMPGWGVDMASAPPEVKACALQAFNESGYVELTLEGPCPGAERFVRRLGFCFSGSSQCNGVAIPEDSADLCQNFQDDDGDGKYDCEDPDCCAHVDCKSYDPSSFCAQQD